MRSRAPVLYAFTLAAIGLALMAAPHRRHPRPKPKHGPATVLLLEPGNNLSLSAAREAGEDSAPDGAAFKLKLALHGGGNKTWVSESCNPVVPIVNGEMRPLRQCFTDFYAKVALAPGRDESFEFLWPISDPQRPLKAGDSVRLLMTLGSDCSKSTGPGLYAFGDCKVREQVLSAPFIIKE